MDQLRDGISKAAPLGNTLKFDFGDDQLCIDGCGSSNQLSASDMEADCIVSLSIIDFIALTKGELNPMNALMAGQIRISGDMNVAMKLQTLFS